MQQNEITIEFENRAPMTLRALPMPILPSKECGATWLAFQKNHVPNTHFDLSEEKRIQAFLIENNTDAMTDGVRCYTMTGGMLALCDPINAVYGFSLGIGWFDTGDGFGSFIKNVDDRDEWLEARIDGPQLRIDAKVHGVLGGFIKCVQTVGSFSVDKTNAAEIAEGIASAQKKINDTLMFA